MGQETIEDELKRRIIEHLSWRNTETVALLWLGYLNGLSEWNIIDPGAYIRLSNLLPNVGNKEIVEMASGEPLTLEREIEIEEYSKSIKP